MSLGEAHDLQVGDQFEWAPDHSQYTVTEVNVIDSMENNCGWLIFYRDGDDHLHAHACDHTPVQIIGRDVA